MGSIPETYNDRRFVFVVHTNKSLRYVSEIVSNCLYPLLILCRQWRCLQTSDSLNMLR